MKVFPPQVEKHLCETLVRAQVFCFLFFKITFRCFWIGGGVQDLEKLTEIGQNLCIYFPQTKICDSSSRGGSDCVTGCNL